MSKRTTLIQQEIAYLAANHPTFLPNVMQAIDEGRLIRGAVIQVEEEHDGTLVVTGEFYGHGTGMVKVYEDRLRDCIAQGIECPDPVSTEEYWNAFGAMSHVACKLFPDRRSEANEDMPEVVQTKITPVSDYLVLYRPTRNQAYAELKAWMSPYISNPFRDERDFRLPAYLLEEVAS